MTKFIPIGPRVLVEAQEEKIQTISGIVLPEKQGEKPMRGKIVAVGTSSEKVKIEVKEGDIVVFKKYSPTEIKIEGKEYLILDHEDILGKIA